MSWASRADRVLPATGQVSDRQYPTRIGCDLAGTLGTLLGVGGEKLHFPSQRNSTATAMLGYDSRNTGGRFLACPCALPFAQHGKPVDRHCTGGDHAAHSHVVGFQRYTARCVGDDKDVI